MRLIHLLFYSFFTILVLLLPIDSYTSITGKVTGFIKDASTKEPLIGVNILVEGTRYGAATGQNGKYILLNIPPDVYTLKILMIGYQTKIIKNVRVLQLMLN